MKKICWILLVFTFYACSVTIEAVVDKNLKQGYNNILVVIPTAYSKRLVEKLKVEFLKDVSKTKCITDVFIFEPKKEELKLDNHSEIDDRIDSLVRNLNKDLVLYMVPSKAYYLNNSLRTMEYNITGLDIEKKTIVWKSKVKIESNFGGIFVMAKEVALKFFNQLVEDNLISGQLITKQELPPK